MVTARDPDHTESGAILHHDGFAPTRVRGADRIRPEHLGAGADDDVLFQVVVRFPFSSCARESRHGRA